MKCFLLLSSLVLLFRSSSSSRKGVLVGVLVGVPVGLGKVGKVGKAGAGGAAVVVAVE